MSQAQLSSQREPQYFPANEWSRYIRECSYYYRIYNIDLGKNVNRKGSNWCHKCSYLYRDEDFCKWMITIKSVNVPIINLGKNADGKISNWRHKCSYFYGDVLNYQWLPMHPRGYKCFSHKPLKECRELKTRRKKQSGWRGKWGRNGKVRWGDTLILH